MNTEQIAAILERHTPLLIKNESRRPAAVALLLRSAAAGTEIFFIERACRFGDPWSGDIGFPGGKVESVDPTTRHAAIRETLEEVGIDLTGATFLGRLGDVVGAAMPVHVSCFVYLTGEPALLRLNSEVRDAFWMPLSELCDPQRHGVISVKFKGKVSQHPAIHLPLDGKPPLWGLTYRLVMEFLSILRDAGNTGGSDHPPCCFSRDLAESA